MRESCAFGLGSTNPILPRLEIGVSSALNASSMRGLVTVPIADLWCRPILEGSEGLVFISYIWTRPPTTE